MLQLHATGKHSSLLLVSAIKSGKKLCNIFVVLLQKNPLITTKVKNIFGNISTEKKIQGYFFYLSTLGSVLHNFLRSKLIPCCNKLECLPLSLTSVLVYHFWARLGSHAQRKRLHQGKVHQCLGVLDQGGISSNGQTLQLTTILN